MIERRPTAEVAGELDPSVGAVSKAAERINADGDPGVLR
jgi:hypothetical protein